MDTLDHIQQLWAQQQPDLDTSSMALIGRLQIVHKQLTQEMSKTFRQFNLTDAGFDVLATLLRSGAPYALTPKLLLAQMLVTSGSMTSRLDSLEKQGLIQRTVGEADKRQRQVRLTTAGKNVITEALLAHVETQQRLLSVLTEQEQNEMIGLLRTFMARSEQV
jgi:DNA-binding MarR family transcriptional regulator